MDNNTKKKYCIYHINFLNYPDLLDLAILLSNKDIVLKQTGDACYINLDTIDNDIVDYIYDYIYTKLPRSN